MLNRRKKNASIAINTLAEYWDMPIRVRDAKVHRFYTDVRVEAPESRINTFLSIWMNEQNAQYLDWIIMRAISWCIEVYALEGLYPSLFELDANEISNLVTSIRKASISVEAP